MSKEGQLSPEAADSAESTHAADPSSEQMRVLEAVLFASPEVLTTARLKTLLPDQPDGRTVRKMINRLNEMFQKERHPFEITERGGGFQFRTVPYYQPWVQQLFKEKSTKRLSIQALESLAIVAYKQPITKAEIEAIRGVLSDGALKTLLERRMITIVGRSDKPGRPLMYGTTRQFLEHFGLNKISDLPAIEEFESMARESFDALTEEELAAIEDFTGDTEQNSSEQQDSGESPSLSRTE